MCNTLSAISNQVTSALDTAQAGVVSFYKHSYQLGSRFIGSITPNITNVVEKIKSINVKALLENTWSVAKSFATSKVGMSSLLLTAAVTTLALSRRIDNKMYKYPLVIAGIATLALSAYVATRPFTLPSLTP